MKDVSWSLSSIFLNAAVAIPKFPPLAEASRFKVTTEVPLRDFVSFSLVTLERSSRSFRNEDFDRWSRNNHKDDLSRSGRHR